MRKKEAAIEEAASLIDAGPVTVETAVNTVASQVGVGAKNALKAIYAVFASGSVSLSDGWKQDSVLTKVGV